MERNCVFCSILRRELPASVIYQTDSILCFMDIKPVNRGHVLIIPKMHAPYLADLDPKFGGDVFKAGMQIAAALRQSGIRCDGINFFLADGEAAGQEVFHVHLHVIPRYENDGFGLRFGPEYGKRPPREELDQVAARIKAAFERVNRTARHPERFVNCLGRHTAPVRRGNLVLPAEALCHPERRRVH